MCFVALRVDVVCHERSLRPTHSWSLSLDQNHKSPSEPPAPQHTQPASPSQNLLAISEFHKTLFCMFFKPFVLWGHRKCPHKPCLHCSTHVIHICVLVNIYTRTHTDKHTHRHKTHTHTHARTHTRTHTHTHTHTQTQDVHPRTPTQDAYAYAHTPTPTHTLVFMVYGDSP